MYIERLMLTDLISIKHLDWHIVNNEAKGWHVIMGDNGSGKTTFIRAIVAALLDDQGMISFGKPDIELSGRFLNTPTVSTKINAWLRPDQEYDVIENVTNCNVVHSEWLIRSLLKPGTLWKWFNVMSDQGTMDQRKSLPTSGWFSCSFGPFRRFSGGDAELEKQYKDFPQIYRHLSAVRESFALSEPLAWLKQLKFEALEDNTQSAALLSSIISFINQPELLPNGARLQEVSSKGVQFRDANGSIVQLEDLSDGYRSILSLTFELLRQLALCYGADLFQSNVDGTIQVKVPGVVLIDEVDAHLHPTWQQRIGFWLLKHFPDMQFIVTTHSPLICQAAKTVFKLPTPGTDEVGTFLEGVELDRLKYGNILEAYASEAFGKIEPSKEGKAKLQRLAELTRDRKSVV